jgi:hypothetical protein
VPSSPLVYVKYQEQTRKEDHNIHILHRLVKRRKCYLITFREVRKSVWRPPQLGALDDRSGRRPLRPTISITRKTNSIHFSYYVSDVAILRSDFIKILAASSVAR